MRIKLWLFLALIQLFSMSGVVWAAGFGEFSADMMTQGEGQNIQGKIFASEGKTRFEMAGTVVISRPDLNVSWVLMPDQGMYMEQPIDRKMAARTSKEFDGEIDRKSLGQETFDGKITEKFLVRYREQNSEQSVYQWIGQEGFPLKVAATDGRWSVEYRNLNPGKQNQALFEIPAGYQKFSMPSAADFASAGNY